MRLDTNSVEPLLPNPTKMSKSQENYSKGQMEIALATSSSTNKILAVQTINCRKETYKEELTW